MYDIVVDEYPKPWYEIVDQDAECDYDIVGKVYENGLKVHGHTNFSPLSQITLENIMLAYKPKIIVEIGVENNIDKNQTSTAIILKNKLPEAYYYGVDLEDRSHLNNVEKRIYTVKEDSSNIEAVMRPLGPPLPTKCIDFLFIDGWHSINQVKREFYGYLPYLPEKGVIGLHDTNHHYGPRWLIETIDRNEWNVVEQHGDRDSDMGISFLWRHNTLT